MFLEELKELLNKHSMENGSKTPDFILADYLCECLQNFDKTSRARERWYGRELKVVEDVKKNNVEIEFRHKKTGCGITERFYMTTKDYEKLKDALSLPGLDIEVQGVEYPYITNKL